MCGCNDAEIASNGLVGGALGFQFGLPLMIGAAILKATGSL
jgi:hypothetical protein